MATTLTNTKGITRGTIIERKIGKMRILSPIGDILYTTFCDY